MLHYKTQSELYMREISIAIFLQIQSDMQDKKSPLMILNGSILFVCLFVVHFFLYFTSYYFLFIKQGAEEKVFMKKTLQPIIHQICIVSCTFTYSFLQRLLPENQGETTWLPSVAQKHLCVSSAHAKSIVKEKRKINNDNDNNNNDNNNNFQYLILYSLNVHYT